MIPVGFAVCPKGAIKEKMANALFELSINAPMRENYTYNEPSELAAIQALRPNAAAVRGKLPADIEDRVRGAWIAESAVVCSESRSRVGARRFWSRF